MNAPQYHDGLEAIELKMQTVLTAQREDYLREGVVTEQTRIDRLDRGIDALLAYHDKTRLLHGQDNGIAITVDDGSAITHDNQSSMLWNFFINKVSHLK